MTIPTLLQSAKCGEVFGPETAEASVKALRDALAIADKALKYAIEGELSPYGIGNKNVIKELEAARATIAAVCKE